MPPRFTAIVIDVDSTLCALEGIDWLAERRDKAMAAEFRLLTAQAMEGAFPLEQIYGMRLERIRPTDAEIAALAEAYRDALSPGAAECIEALRSAGVACRIVSGGIRNAILPLARALAFQDEDVHAVPLHFASDGSYYGFDRESPLATSTGKRDVVAAMHLPRPSLALGDGVSDAALRGVVDTFAAFTGVVARAAVIEVADFRVVSFGEVGRLVLDGEPREPE